jgi:xanthine dehydrogenase iron-sulfur cluster and FAD-binding subunit A
VPRSASTGAPRQARRHPLLHERSSSGRRNTTSQLGPVSESAAEKMIATYAHTSVAALERIEDVANADNVCRCARYGLMERAGSVLASQAESFRQALSVSA